MNSNVIILMPSLTQIDIFIACQDFSHIFFQGNNMTTLHISSSIIDISINERITCIILLQISDPDRVMSKRERNVRQMMEYVTNPDRDQQTVIREIQAVERTMQGAWDTNRHCKVIILISCLGCRERCCGHTTC